ncbi:MAG: hypothetical protein NTX56_04110 [Proteobacteria bacterium]|nr:hypothetical protein [Pseudomonadota bacterium]
MEVLMSRRARRRAEVELFNFSFLDILACVIGLLIFVLTIVVISGGKAVSRQAGGRLANAEHLLDRTRVAAKMAAERRQRAEETLGQRSKNLGDPRRAADALRAQTQLLKDETVRLDSAAAASLATLQSLEKTIQESTGPVPKDAALIDIQNQLRQFEETTERLQNQVAARKAMAQAKPRQVQYYVPRLREVRRSTVWVEVVGDRLWCVESEDYRNEPIDARSNRYTRRPGVAGTSVSALIGGEVRSPSAIATARPTNSVLSVVVHPDAYEAYRKLRQWAWDKGFSVNWAPADGGPIVLTRSEHVFEQ